MTAPARVAATFCLVLLMLPACGDDAGSGSGSGASASVVDSGRGRGGTVDTGGTGQTDDTGDTGGVDDPAPGDGSSQTDTGNPADVPVRPDTAACESEGFFLKPDETQLANIMLVVDRSNSMNDGTRWADLTGALRGVTRPLEDVVAFGLMLFPAPSGGVLSACTTGEVLVDPGLFTATDVSNTLGTNPPAGGTPTAASLFEARTALLAAHPSGNNYVLLATDGGPGCNPALNASTCTCIPGATCVNSDNCLDDIRTLEAVAALAADGIPTFVIGVPGSETVSDLLDQMAVAGGTDVAGSHYAVTGGTDLAEALRATTGSLVPCDYEFRDAPDDISSLTVTIDDAVIPRDETGTDGWDYVDDVLHLYGSACNRLRDGNSHTVDAAFDCEE